MKLTRNEFKTKLEAMKGSQFLGGLETKTKTGKTLKGVGIVDKFTSYSNVSSGQNYEKKMQKKNPEFKAQKLTWGKWVNYGILIEHKGKHYLRVVVEEHNKSKIKTTYLYKGERVNKSSNVDLFTPSQLKKRDLPPVMAINIDNIKSVNFNKEQYEII